MNKQIKELAKKYRQEILQDLTDLKQASMGEEGLIVARIEVKRLFLKDLNALTE